MHLTARETATAHTWAAPPLIPGDWRDLPLHEALPLLLHVAQCAGTDAEQLPVGWATAVRLMRPSFYPGSVLGEVQVQMADGLVGLYNFLYSPTHMFLLTGKAAPIHEHNAASGIRIDSEAQATDYLTFFCSVVHGADGQRFAIVQTAEDAFGRSAAAPSPALPAEVSEAIRPVVCQAQSDGSYVAEKVTVRYGSGFFSATFKVHQGGNVEMVEDEAIAQVDAPAEVFRGTCWVMSAPVDPTVGASGDVVTH